ncbi:hypothetical protein JCM1841_005643 [Sporobolomyces salmonicolor]
MAAAHAKVRDKSARGLTDKQLAGFCFERASEPLRRDIVVFHNVKLKQTLGSKAVGSHVASVGGWDAKKHKLRVLEVDAKNGRVDEGSYKLDGVKQGKIEVFRMVPRNWNMLRLKPKVFAGGQALAAAKKTPPQEPRLMRSAWLFMLENHT